MTNQILLFSISTVLLFVLCTSRVYIKQSWNEVNESITQALRVESVLARRSHFRQSSTRQTTTSSNLLRPLLSPIMIRPTSFVLLLLLMRRR